MNPFKACFSACGLIYILLFVWSCFSHLAGSAVISAIGLMLCSAGWFMSDHYLS